MLDLNDHTIKTLPVSQVLQHDYPALRYVASLDKGDYLVPIFARLTGSEPGRVLLTFDRLVGDAAFIELMKAILNSLERATAGPSTSSSPLTSSRGTRRPPIPSTCSNADRR